MISELAPGIFSIETHFVDGMNGIIIGRRGALAIDVGFDSKTGVETAAFIEAQGAAPNQVVLTHGHSDHVLGGSAFRGAQVYASTSTPAEIHRHLGGYARSQNVPSENLIEQALFPTVMFSDELHIDLEDCQLRLFPTPGHSRDHVSVYVLPHRILFAGDTVVTGIVPAINDGDSRVLEATLHKLLALEIDLLVAGHGAPLVGAAAIRAWIEWEISYLSGVRAAISDALAAGESLSRENLAVILPYNDWIGARLPADKHGMPRRHIDAASRIAAELQLENQPVSLPKDVSA